MEFIHVHSMYSKFDSPQKPDELVRRVKELGGKSVTLTDHGTMLGIEPFMDAGKKYGINTVPGVEAYTEGRQHLLIVARDYTGYLQISYAMRDASAHQEHSRGNKNLIYPIMTDDIIEKYFSGSEHVIATSACIAGPLSSVLLRKRRTERKAQKLLDDSTAEDHVIYRNAEAKLKAIEARLAVIKEDRKEQNAFLKKSFLNRLEKKEKWLEKNRLCEGSDIRKAEAECETTRMQVENAKKMTEIYDRQEKELKKIKKEKRAAMKKAKSGENRYQEAAELLSDVCSDTAESLYAEAEKRLKWLKDIFPFFYIELQYHGIEDEAYVMPILAEMAEKTDTPIIAANDAHITCGDENSIEARRILRFNYFQKAEEVSPSDRELYLKSEDELQNALEKILPHETVEEAIRNTDIINECHVVFPEGKHYPSITKEGMKPEEYFDELLEKARTERIQKGLWNDEYQKRLEHEVQVIKSMGFVDYHLVVRDFCIAGRNLGKIPKDRMQDAPEKYEDTLDWIRQEGFDVGAGIGPGRGSACGSLVCNMLGITGIDPIKYDLLFERFLNPERVSMPDIDTDVSSTVRPILIRYIKETYGERAVCSIATVTTYSAKSAVQMAGRDRAAQLYPGDKGKEKRRKYLHQNTYPLSDLIPEGPKVTLAGCEDDVMRQIQRDEEKMLIWKRAKLIEGCLSGTGVHAGGVIISDNDNVNDYIPLAYNSEQNVWVAQCDMVRAEEKGLLKMDLLGLNTLDIITDCLNLIKKNRGESLDISALKFEPEIFRDIYATGNTNNVFQFESPGMKSTLKKFRPERFDDIILLNAAFRPGPMQYLDGIIEVKNTGKIKKSCLTEIPELKEILAPTYMSIIYQEQVMKIFQKLAGYSLGGADLVRRFMSKKKTEKLKEERKAFIYGDAERNIKGCVANGISEKLADELFDQMMEFAKYAFNKSHACAYSYNSYITAYLKYHYPVEFLCATFNNKESKDYGPIIEDCRRYGIRVLPPDANRSFYDFVTEGTNAIRFGLRGIKGIGEANRSYIESFCRERSLHGGYVSVQDFLKRNFIIAPAKTGYKAGTPGKSFMQTVISCGFFDRYCQNRKYLASLFPKAIVGIGQTEEAAKEKLYALLDGLHIVHDRRDMAYNIRSEMETAGMILTDNPLQKYMSDSSMIDLDDVQDTHGNVSVLAIITAAEEGRSSNGNDMLSLSIISKRTSGVIRGFGRFAEKYSQIPEWMLYRPVKIEGSFRNGYFRPEKILRIEPPKQFSAEITSRIQFERLKKSSSDDPGSLSVFFLLKGKNKSRCLNLQISGKDRSDLEALGVEFSEFTSSHI